MDFLLRVYNLVVDAGDVAFAACIFVFLPLAFFRSKRKLAGGGLKLAGCIFLVSLWMYELGALWHYWGLVAVVVGVIFTPFGAAVIAGIAVLLHRDWWALFVIVSELVLVGLAWVIGGWLEENSFLGPGLVGSDGMLPLAETDHEAEREQ